MGIETLWASGSGLELLALLVENLMFLILGRVDLAVSIVVYFIFFIEIGILVVLNF